MIECTDFFNLLKKNNFEFMTGVPCSIFKHFINYINDQEYFSHVIASCEGQACGIASGYNLATNKIPIIYMQNSGLGNSVNPLTSLINKSMFKIPILLFISWRGEPDKKDAPQHTKMGEILIPLLKLLDIPYSILNVHDNLEQKFSIAKDYMLNNQLPYAFIFPKNFFSEYTSKSVNLQSDLLMREEAIIQILENLNGDEVLMSTTGKTGRECYENLKKNNLNNPSFYNLGSMGNATPMALGIALNTKKKVIVLDGDGAILMKKGILATIGYYQPKNLLHILFDNGCYESTGGQKTVSEKIDFIKIVEACNYNNCKFADSIESIQNNLGEMLNSGGPNLLVIKVAKGARKDLGRPYESPEELKLKFRTSLENI